MKTLKEILNKEFTLTPLFLLKIMLACAAIGSIIALLTATGGVFIVVLVIIIACIEVYNALIDKPDPEDQTKKE